MYHGGERGADGRGTAVHPEYNAKLKHSHLKNVSISLQRLSLLVVKCLDIILFLLGRVLGRSQ